MPHWDRSLAEAADLFDSMYVSLYKGLGGSDHRAWAIDLAAALREHGLRTSRRCRTALPSWPTPQARPTRSTNERVVAFTEERGIVPSGLWRDADVPGWVETELTCYESAISHDPAEVARLVAEAVLAANLLP